MNRFSPLAAARPAVALLVSIAVASITAAPPAHAQKQAEIERGRYLVKTTGCNDCHTDGYAEAAGKVDEKLWLTGSPLGWRGPWGTTYPANLRLVAHGMSEPQWMKHARNEWRPPMPWFNLRDMSDRDVVAIYRYLKFLGPAGERAPAYVAPDREPAQPYVMFPAPPK